jgi:hypothetical protein
MDDLSCMSFKASLWIALLANKKEQMSRLRNVRDIE